MPQLCWQDVTMDWNMARPMSEMTGTTVRGPMNLQHIDHSVAFSYLPKEGFLGRFRAVVLRNVFLGK